MLKSRRTHLHFRDILLHADCVRPHGTTSRVDFAFMVWKYLHKWQRVQCLELRFKENVFNPAPLLATAYSSCIQISPLPHHSVVTGLFSEAPWLWPMRLLLLIACNAVEQCCIIYNFEMYRVLHHFIGATHETQTFTEECAYTASAPTTDGQWNLM